MIYLRIGGILLRELARASFAPIYALLQFIALQSMVNIGGTMAHIGGLAMGYFFVRQMYAGRDWSIGFNRAVDWLVALFSGLFGRRRPRVAYRGASAGQRARTGANRPRKKAAAAAGGSAGATDKTQARIDAINGARGTYFCGAWCGWGFHEDGVKSALAVARHFEKELADVA